MTAPMIGAEDASADLLPALKAGEPVCTELVNRLMFPLTDETVPDWHATLGRLLSLPEIGGRGSSQEG